MAERKIFDIKKIGAAAGYTPKQIDAAIETNGHLMVPVEQFAQAKTSPDLLDAVSFAPEADSMARMRRDAKAVMEQMQKNNIAAVERQEKLTDKMLDEYLPVHEDGSVDADGRNLMKAAIYTNPASPAQGWRDMHKQLRAELDEYIAPALARLKEGMGKGGQILRVEDENGQEKYIRGTENDPWYSAFYKEHKRKPTAAELEDMAVDMTTGKSSLNIEGFTPRTAEEAEAMAEAAPAIENLRKTLAVMDRIKPHMKEMTGAEMRLTEGLSQEAFHVYRDLAKKLTEIGGQTAPVARLNAILFARHADIFADIVSKKTGEKLTAKDYYERFFGLDSEGKYKADLYQAVAQGVNLNEKVPVLDFDSMKNVLKKVNKDGVLDYIRSISTTKPIPTADFRALVGIPSNADDYGQRHILFGKSQGRMRNTKARNKTLSNLATVLQNGHVIDISTNTKVRPLTGLKGHARKVQERKNSVRRYYRIMLPVKVGGQLETLIITAEDMNGTVSINPQNVSLYEIQVTDKNKGPHTTAPQKGVRVANGVPSHITIKDMLRGVKDADKNFYIDPVTDKANFDPIHSLPQQILDQIAWHGSPHTFYEFLLSAINSGEGAQAHGWGLYFAKFREVAERYRGELAGDEDVILYYGDRYENTSDGWMLKDDSGDGGNIIDSTDPTANAFDAFARAGGDVKEAIKELQAELDEIKENLDEDENLEDDPDAVRIQETIEVLENDGDDMTLGDPGSLFQVEIPDDDVLLEEDQGYADQRPKVKAALDKLAQHWETADESSPQADFAENYKNMTGEELYRVLSRIDGDQYASELLNEYGIEGIAYNGGRDGRCYVIFNDAVIDIVERLEQAARRVEQGYISRFSNGQRIVTLLKDADASTFLHEMGHLFLFDLEYLARYDETSAKELELVNKWAEWHEGAAKEGREYIAISPILWYNMMSDNHCMKEGMHCWRLRECLLTMGKARRRYTRWRIRQFMWHMVRCMRSSARPAAANLPSCGSRRDCCILRQGRCAWTMRPLIRCAAASVFCRRTTGCFRGKRYVKISSSACGSKERLDGLVRALLRKSSPISDSPISLTATRASFRAGSSSAWGLRACFCSLPICC